RSRARGTACDRQGRRSAPEPRMKQGQAPFPVEAGRDLPAPAKKGDSPHWDLASISGRLVEISASPSGAPLTLAFRLVLDAQKRSEPVAWVGGKDEPFYPPDVADGGIDLAALPVVWTKDPIGAAKAADLLVRSGAFGLVVVDLGIDARLPADHPPHRAA